jgi:hypothetical protein
VSAECRVYKRKTHQVNEETTALYFAPSYFYSSCENYPLCLSQSTPQIVLCNPWFGCVMVAVMIGEVVSYIINITVPVLIKVISCVMFPLFLRLMSSY